MATKLVVKKIESVTPEKGEYARVKLTFVDGSFCVIVVGTSRTQNKPSFTGFRVEHIAQGEEIVALWDQEKEKISLSGSEAAYKVFCAVWKR